MRLYTLAAVIGLALTVLACSASPVSDKVVIAIQPTLAADEMIEKAKPLEQYLETRLANVDVVIYVPLSQAGVIEALRFGQADVALLGAWPAYLASEKAGAELALAEVREVLIDGRKQNATFYYSYWVVPKESAAQSLADLKEKRVCFPSPISTSGYVAPVGRLIELNLLSKPEKGEADPGSYFGEVRFGGGYQQCWEALKGGQVDATVIAGDVPTALYDQVLANTRVIEQQGPIPSHGVLLGKDLQEPLRTRVVEAIEGLSEPQYRDLMRGFVSGIFVGFERSSADKHLATLKRYLQQGGLTYTEKISP